MKWIVAAFVVGVLVGQLSQDRSLKFGGYRIGFGSDGYALQSTTDWRTVSQGWFPWHKPVESWAIIQPGEPRQVLYRKEDGNWAWVDQRKDKPE